MPLRGRAPLRVVLETPVGWWAALGAALKAGGRARLVAVRPAAADWTELEAALAQGGWGGALAGLELVGTAGTRRGPHAPAPEAEASSKAPGGGRAGGALRHGFIFRAPAAEPCSAHELAALVYEHFAPGPPPFEGGLAAVYALP